MPGICGVLFPGIIHLANKICHYVLHCMYYSSVGCMVVCIIVYMNYVYAFVFVCACVCMYVSVCVYISYLYACVCVFVCACVCVR